MRFKKPCKHCDKLFRPYSKENKVCASCTKKNRVKGMKKQQHRKGTLLDMRRNGFT